MHYSDCPHAKVYVVMSLGAVDWQATDGCEGRSRRFRLVHIVVIRYVVASRGGSCSSCSIFLSNSGAA